RSLLCRLVPWRLAGPFFLIYDTTTLPSLRHCTASASGRSNPLVTWTSDRSSAILISWEVINRAYPDAELGGLSGGLFGSALRVGSGHSLAVHPLRRGAASFGCTTSKRR